MNYAQESLFIPVGNGDDRLHIKRFCPEHPRAAILMLHGSIENGRIFYDATGEKGLAPYLAREGFDVFVGDLAGRGLSTPHINRATEHGMHDSIRLDIPAMQAAVEAHTRVDKIHWIAHSWGGVLMASYWAFNPRVNIASFMCFGTKRSVKAQNWRKWIGIDLIWNRLSYLPVAFCGYLPARALGLGSDDESRRSHAESVVWVRTPHEWIDPVDGFDYRAAWAATDKRPPARFYMAPLDHYLGNPRDVEYFARECGYEITTLRMLSKAAGCQMDYDHVNMLTHPVALSDHFPQVLSWLSRH